MKAGFAIALMSASALALGAAAARAEESLTVEPQTAQTEALQADPAQNVAFLPLPPTRPTVAAQAPAPRRIRVAQASTPRPAAVVQPAVVRKPQIWLSMGYGF